MSTTTKELVILLKNPDSCYYPGDFVHGQIILNLRKSVDVQHIAVAFTGCIEVCGDKVPLINEVKLLLATPKNNQKYTTLIPGQRHSFNFEFKIPVDKKLPSCANIPKVAKISYVLTATHKKPMFSFSHALSSATHEIKMFDRIDVLLPDYRAPVKISNDLGFITGNKLSQWGLEVAKSAFIQGENIKLKCQISHFPAMKKSKAIKLSLTRQVYRYKTSSAKILENKVLSTTAVDIDTTTDNTSSLNIPIELHIPYDTPPSIFPDSGRTMSVSYVIQAELKMKGVKSAIKLKSVYRKEVTIVVGTFSMDNMNTAAAPLSSSLSMHRKSTTNLLPTRRKSASPSAAAQLQVSFSELDNIKPLPRLDNIKPLPRLDNNTIHKRQHNNTPVPSASSLSPTQSCSMRTSSYQHEFDDYIPTMPLRRLSLSSARSSTSTAVTATSSADRSLMPLPSMKSIKVNPYSTVSYLNRKSAPRPSVRSVHSPHEIGPNDIITKQQQGGCYFNDEKTNDEEHGSPIPGLLSRHDTISTASSSGIAADPYQAAFATTTKATIAMAPMDRAS